jgi:hypothetical protein
MIVVADRRRSRVVESDGFAWLHVTIESDDEALGALLDEHALGRVSRRGPAVLEGAGVPGTGAGRSDAIRLGRPVARVIGHTTAKG